MTWKVLEHFTVYREQNMYAAHPNVVRTDTGDLLAIFHRSPFLGHSNHSNPLFNLYPPAKYLLILVLSDIFTNNILHKYC